VAAIPATGGARCVPRRVMRALSRAVVLGGLVIAGWLLGSGLGLANEDLGQPDIGLAQLVSPQLASDPGERTAPFDGGSDGQLGVPPTVGSAGTRVLSTLPVPQRSVQPPVKLGVLEPLVNTVGVPKPLAHVLAAPILTPPILAAASGPAAVPPAESAARAAAATASVSTRGPARGPVIVFTTVNHTRPTAAPTADPVAGQLALANDPAVPVPASPPGSTSSPCVIGSTGNGAGTKSAPDVAVNDSWATVGLTPMYRLLYLSASDLPRSPAAQPSTSPD
jgi:hypothetical protein